MSFFDALWIPSFKKLTRIFRAQKSFIGLNIAGSSIKLVELRKKESQAVLQTYGELDIAKWRKEHASGLFAAEPTFEEFVAMTKELLREARVSGTVAIVAIPVAQSFIVPIELPRLTPEEIESAVPFEARKYLPIPLEEVSLVWQVLDSAHEVMKDRLRVLLIATPKNVTSTYQKIAQGAGLEVLGFELEPFSIVRAAMTPQDRRGTVLFDFGSNRVNIVLYVDHRIEVVASIIQGTMDLALALSRSLAISHERADELMRLHGISRRSEERGIGEVLSPLIDRVLLQAQHTIRDFTTQTGKTVERVLISGGGSRLPGLPEYISEVMGFEVRAVDSFRKVVYPVTLEPIIRSISPSMAVAVGLALKGFEL